nr:phosphoribosyl transferase [Acidithiobacillus ferrianus]
MAVIPPRFASREAAAELLARNLAPYDGRHPLVLAIPRGALPMGRIIADALHGDLDVVLVRKIGAPGNPEYAIGAVDEEGQIWTDPLAGRLGIDGRYMRDEAARQLKVIKTRRAQYTPIHPAIDPRGRVVIVVDDGVATGATLGAALRLLRQRRPARLVAAFAVAPPDTIARLQPLADDLVYLSAPEPFHAVGEFFTDFREVKDEEVLRILRGISPPRQGSEHP